MHTVLVTFESTAKAEDLIAPFTEYANALNELPGFIMKTWLKQGSTLGGFHLFTDLASAQHYLDGMFASTIPTNPAFSNVRIEHFDVLEGLSQICRTPQPLTQLASPV